MLNYANIGRLDKCVLQKCIYGSCNKTLCNFKEFNKYIKNSGVDIVKLKKPFKYNEAETVNIELKNILNNILTTVSNGDNIIISSNITGNGKTTYATWLGAAYLLYKKEPGYYARCLYNDVQYPLFFIGETNLLSINKNRYLNDATKELYLKYDYICKNTELLIYDDLGTCSSDDYKNWLITIIDYRISKKLSTIYTSNYDYKQLFNALSSRLHDRVIDNTIYIQFKAKSVRGLKRVINYDN